jgi:hypothetical protein
MIISKNTQLSQFDFWGSAEDDVAKLTISQLDNIEDALIELYPNGIDATALNDLFRFEFDWVISLIGLSEDDLNDEDGDE